MKDLDTRYGAWRVTLLFSLIATTAICQRLCRPKASSKCTPRCLALIYWAEHLCHLTQSFRRLRSLHSIVAERFSSYRFAYALQSCRRMKATSPSSCPWLQLRVRVIDGEWRVNGEFVRALDLWGGVRMVRNMGLGIWGGRVLLVWGGDVVRFAGVTV